MLLLQDDWIVFGGGVGGVVVQKWMFSLGLICSVRRRLRLFLAANSPTC